MLNNLTYGDSDHLTDESKKLTFLNFPDWQLTPIRPVGRRNDSSLLSERAGYHSEPGPLTRLCITNKHIHKRKAFTTETFAHAQ